MKIGFKRITRVLLGAALVAGGVSANAASVSSLLFPNELNQLSDNSLNWLVNADGSLSGGGDSILEVGDKIRATFTIDTIEDLSGGGGTNDLGGASGNSELTFVEQILVTGKSAAGGVGGGFFFTFGADPAFAAEWEGKLGLAAGDLAGATAVGFEDGTPNYERTDSGVGTQAARLTALEALATDGTFVIAIGFGDADDVIGSTQALSSDDVLTVKGTAAGTTAGVFAFQQSFIPGTNSLFDENTQVPAGFSFDDGLVDVNGSVNIVGVGGVNTPGDWFDDFNAVFAPVPEPGMSALLGMSLATLGIVGGLRRRRSRS